jgi:hypothetical protein
VIGIAKHVAFARTYYLFMAHEQGVSCKIKNKMIFMIQKWVLQLDTVINDVKKIDIFMGQIKKGSIYLIEN